MKKPVIILFQRNHHSWGFQFGPVFFYWPYLKNWMKGMKPWGGWDETEWL